MKRSWLWTLLGSYLLLLIASYGVLFLKEEPPIPPEVETAVVSRDGGPDTIRLRYLDIRPEVEGVPVVLVHGSPGSSQSMRTLADKLSGYRVIVPDMPGMGFSEKSVPDYSFEAGGEYLLQTLRSLGISQYHLVGFSQGGGVILTIADRAPEQVASLTMLSAIGDIEHELLGSYRLNHAIHGLQLTGLRALYYLTPHFGLLPNGTYFARNFFDSDQRPLTEIMRNLKTRSLIIHGDYDFLVPYQAALSHHALIPDSQLVTVVGDDHFMAIQDQEYVATILKTFFEEGDLSLFMNEVTSEMASTKNGVRYVLIFLVILSSFVLEDLALIAAGVLVATGKLSFAEAMVAGVMGLLLGDVLLYWLGRILRGALKESWVHKIVSHGAVAKGTTILKKYGRPVIFIARGIPGTRFPVFTASGFLKIPFSLFFSTALVATLFWTPLIIILSRYVGDLAQKLQVVEGLVVFLIFIGFLLLLLRRFKK